MKQTLIALVLIPCLSQMGWADTANDILAEASIHGGIIVHLGCGNGELTSALCRSGEYLVHGLDRDAANVESARQRFVEKGQHQKVTVECWSQRTLPFIDNQVNLVVVEDAGDISMDEILRVLCPHGVVMVRTGDTWKKTVKPRPADIDQWTHFLRDASNNAVAKDKKIGPPRHLQWKAGPAFTRDHDSFPGSAKTEEIIVHEGMLLAAVGDPNVLTDAVSKVDGFWQIEARDVKQVRRQILDEHNIPAEPAYDGLAVAYGRIYLPLKGGTVICLDSL